jgi:transcriptional regulator with XRE-family HTH domain
MVTRSIAVTIRSKKLGVLINNARQVNATPAPTCAQVMGIPLAQYEAYERGELSPSLPELEALAFFLKIPLDYFWGRDITGIPISEAPVPDSSRLMALRDRFIGASIRRSRLEAGLTIEDLSEKVGIPPNQLQGYEFGTQPIPIPELEVIATALNRPLKEFQDNRGPIGTWIKQQRAVQNFAELSPELQDFISKPINRPYIELAYRLSEMSVEKLRAVAEGLLEITL